MSLDTIKKEAAALDETSRKDLVSFLISLREQEWAGHALKLGSALDDPDPNRWVTLDDFKARLDKIPEPSAN